MTVKELKSELEKFTEDTQVSIGINKSFITDYVSINKVSPVVFVGIQFCCIEIDE